MIDSHSLTALTDRQVSFLKGIADRKFRQGYTTMALMKFSVGELERSMVAAVCLLDVQEADQLPGLTKDERNFVRSVHRVIKSFLAGSQCA